VDLNFTLATLNASLNGSAALLLFFGWRAIRRKNERLHKRLMGSAFVLSVLFLISYLTRVYLGGVHPYPGSGLLRFIYLSILFSHITLATLVPFLAVRTIYLALKRRLESHRRIARWTLPIWMYVSITGVIIYGMLYI
jgi:putative membrane protein